MNIKEKFVELTSQTYPHGTEDQLFDKLPDFLKQDQFGNLFYQIGEEPTTMFTAHLDTSSYDQRVVNHVFDGRYIFSDGSSILGADDKAGVCILLALIEHKVPGLYYFFLGEERGCVGSRKVASLHKTNPISHINKVVSFDRRGYDSVITHQLSGRCCSNDFAKELSYKLNLVSKGLEGLEFDYMPDSTGIYTDSAQFVDIYSECTNISVGYQNEHSTYESQDIEHLEKLAKVVVLINWDELKTHRNPNKYVDLYDDDDIYEPGIGYVKSYSNNDWNNFKNYDYDDKECKKKVIILDEFYYGHESEITYDYNTFEIIKVKLHAARLMNEKEKISRMLDTLEIEYDNLEWNGNQLTIQQLGQKDVTLNRTEVETIVPSINNWINGELVGFKHDYY